MPGDGSGARPRYSDSSQLRKPAAVRLVRSHAAGHATNLLSGRNDVFVHDHGWFCDFTCRVDADTRRAERVAGLHGRIRAWVSRVSDN